MSDCCCSVARSCLTLWDPMDCSTTGFPVFHHLPDLAQTLVHCVGDAVQPSHFLLSPLFPPSIFPCIKVFSNELSLPIRRLQHQSFQWIFRIDFLWDWLVWSPCSPRDSQESSPALQFKSINFSALNLFYGPTLTSVHDYWKNHSFDYMHLCQQSDVSVLIRCAGLPWSSFRGTRIF